MFSHATHTQSPWLGWCQVRPPMPFWRTPVKERWTRWSLSSNTARTLFRPSNSSSRWVVLNVWLVRFSPGMKFAVPTGYQVPLTAHCCWFYFFSKTWAASATRRRPPRWATASLCRRSSVWGRSGGDWRSRGATLRGRGGSSPRRRYDWAKRWRSHLNVNELETS